MSKKSYAERNLKFETLQLHVGQENPEHAYTSWKGILARSLPYRR